MKDRHARRSHFVSDLLQQLPAFGLDPRDWSVYRLPHAAKVEMRHRRDDGFRLQASFRTRFDGRPRLGRLTLASL